jgi:hypothetical protein
MVLFLQHNNKTQVRVSLYGGNLGIASNSTQWVQLPLPHYRSYSAHEKKPKNTPRACGSAVWTPFEVFSQRQSRPVVFLMVGMLLSNLFKYSWSCWTCSILFVFSVFPAHFFLVHVCLIWRSTLITVCVFMIIWWFFRVAADVVKIAVMHRLFLDITPHDWLPSMFLCLHKLFSRLCSLRFFSSHQLDCNSFASFPTTTIIYRCPLAVL